METGWKCMLMDEIKEQVPKVRQVKFIQWNVAVF